MVFFIASPTSKVYEVEGTFRTVRNATSISYTCTKFHFFGKHYFVTVEHNNTRLLLCSEPTTITQPVKSNTWDSSTIAYQMGNSLQKSIYNPPRTFRECFNEGKLDIGKYIIYRRRVEENEDAMATLLKICSDIQLQKKRKAESVYDESSKKPRFHRRCVKRHAILVRNDDGELEQLQPKTTIWYRLYVCSTPTNKRIHNLFRRRFRLPHSAYLRLLDDVKNHPSFAEYHRLDAVGHRSTLLSLLLLGALRYLGRSWTFDDLEESTAISRESHRQFFLKFIKFGSIGLFNRYVRDAADSLRMSDLTDLFSQAGFNGCIGSTDATHVPMLSCASWAQIVHIGSKTKIPCRTYNLTVSHSRQILGTTTGHPATFNDKTLIMFDRLLTGINNGQYQNDHRFTLLEKDKDNNIVEVNYVGAWFIVDNGYLNWSCTVAPIKHATSYKFIRVSEWLESMRKDVECTFGILKGRFTILKTGVKLRNFELVDQIWLTCCALHNMLLFIDGLDEGWEEGELSHWEKINEGCRAPKNMSFAEIRLNRDLSSQATDIDESELNDNDYNFIKLATINNVRHLNLLPLKVFRKLVANHFDIRFNKNSVSWPKRVKKHPRI